MCNLLPATAPSPTNAPLKADNTLDTSLNNYSTGAACNVVLVRAFYTWTVYTPA